MLLPTMWLLLTGSLVRRPSGLSLLSGRKVPPALRGLTGHKAHRVFKVWLALPVLTVHRGHRAFKAQQVPMVLTGGSWHAPRQR